MRKFLKSWITCSLNLLRKHRSWVQRKFNYFVRGSITVQLTSCLIGLDSTKLVNLFWIPHEQSSWILNSQTGGPPCSDTSPYKVRECSLLFPFNCYNSVCTASLPCLKQAWPHWKHWEKTKELLIGSTHISYKRSKRFNRRNKILPVWPDGRKMFDFLALYIYENLPNSIQIWQSRF